MVLIPLETQPAYREGAFFSLGHRITLIQACFSNIPAYILSLFKIPGKVANRIEKIMRFPLVWGEKML